MSTKAASEEDLREPSKVVQGSRAYTKPVGHFGRRFDNSAPLQRYSKSKDDSKEKVDHYVTNVELIPEKLELYKRKFRAFDLDKDGVIGMRELATVTRVQGYKLTREELAEMFGKTELDLEKGITFDDFVKTMEKRANDKKKSDFAEIKQAFKEYCGHQGYVTADDAYPILREELGFTLRKTEDLMDEFDKNGDYRLSIHEFVPFYRRIKQLKEAIIMAFQQFDKNGDGFVDIGEAIEHLKPKGFTEEQIKRMFARHDTDGDGRLNVNEFAGLWDVSENF